MIGRSVPLTNEQKDKFCNEHCIHVTGVEHCYLDCKYTLEDVAKWFKEKYSSKTETK